uniref:Uncharacterized protein n=1 Tax=Romanomermis culicivorax TaxID=13658 RepID=A0A915KH55_ROMCU
MMDDRTILTIVRQILSFTDGKFEVEQKSHGADSWETDIRWHPRFCVLRPDEQSFVCFKTEHAGNKVGRHLQNIRLDDGARPFYRDVEYFDKFRRHLGGKDHRIDMIYETMSEHYCDFDENSIYGTNSLYTPAKTRKKVQFDAYSLHESLYASLSNLFDKGGFHGLTSTIL